jgi:CHAT domain-containing protein
VAIREYRDFILVADNVEISSIDKPSQVTITVFDSPVGQGEQKETVTIPGDVHQAVRWLGARNLDKSLERQIALGEQLAAILLPPYARRLFAESLNMLQDFQGLRLRLRLDDHLADLPWEYLYITDARGAKSAAGFLLLDPRISLVRHEALAVPGDWFAAPARRRIVIAMASPKPYEKYPKLQHLPQEQRSIREALVTVEAVDVVFVPVYEDGATTGEPSGVTVRRLAEALMERTDIFHFSGHGSYIQGSATGDAQGVLVFSDANNNAFEVSSNTFAELLKSKGVRLVVLGACEGGRRDGGENVWNGVAAALLRVGIPAVVAMQFTIDDRLGAAFIAAFYQALVAGRTVDEAVATGRAAIRIAALNGNKDVRDWGVPVLYLRSPGGTIFKPVQDPAIVARAEMRTAQVVEQSVREVGTTGRLIGAEIDELTPDSDIIVNQKIKQEAKGFVLGGKVFRLEGGRLTVKMEADVVSGTMVGLQLGKFGKSARADSENEAASELENYLRPK